MNLYVLTSSEDEDYFLVSESTSDAETKLLSILNDIGYDEKFYIKTIRFLAKEPTSNYDINKQELRLILENTCKKK